MGSSAPLIVPAEPVIDSTTPLLQKTRSAQDDEAQSHQDAGVALYDRATDDRPLPKLQIFLLSLTRLVEPLSFFCIFPYINQMIWETGGVEETDVGFYSGIVESMFNVTLMLLMIQWGRASDRFGRKPVMIFSLIGTGISMSMFGLSTKIWHMVFFRSVAGFFCGSVVTVRTMMAENSTAKTQARAFSFFAMASNIGIFVGPLIGGVLSKPATQYSSLFGGIQFLQDYPYCLPTFVIGLFTLSIALANFIYLKETLNRESNDASSENMMSTWEILKYPGVGVVLFIYLTVTLLGTAYTAVSPLFWFTDVKHGGFGFSPVRISVFIALAGLSQALWIILAFPPLQRRYGSGGVLRVCAIFWPIMFGLWPTCNFFFRQGWLHAFWAIAPINLTVGSGVSMAFTVVQLTVNDIAPNQGTLGTLNAIALTCNSAIRGISPALFSSLFATGARTQFMDGYFIWVILILISLVLIVAVKYLPAKAEGTIVEDTVSD